MDETIGRSCTQSSGRLGQTAPLPIAHRRPKAIFVGWFSFEGFGRPFEAWAIQNGTHATQGRCFTFRGALRKARKASR